MLVDSLLQYQYKELDFETLPYILAIGYALRFFVTNRTFTKSKCRQKSSKNKKGPRHGGGCSERIDSEVTWSLMPAADPDFYFQAKAATGTGTSTAQTHTEALVWFGLVYNYGL